MTDEAHDCDDAGAPVLTRAETLLLWAIRAWVAGHRHGIAVIANLRTTFRNEGAPAAAEAVDDLMGFIGDSAGRTIQVNCPRCRQVTKDERLLLDIVALHQQGDALWAPFLARVILTPMAARVSGPPFAALAEALRDGGILLPPVAGQVPPPDAVAHAVPAGATVH